ncbi:helix-turn-helix domain-containing protein [Embleya sp. NPDC055664]
MADLLDGGQIRPTVKCIDAHELAQIRATVNHPEVILAGLGADDEDAPVDLDMLRRRVAYGWTAFQAGDYVPLGRELPDLLMTGSRAVVRADGDQQMSAYALLSMTYQLTVAVATKYADQNLARHAADRSLVAADRSHDPVAIAGATRHVADAMFHGGEGAAAVTFAAAVARTLERDLVARGTHGLSVLGMLHLKAAMAAADAGARTQVPEFLAEAEVVANRLGADANVLWTAFGPTNVRIHRVSALVRLQQGGDAIAESARVSASSLLTLPRERRAHHTVDVAMGLFGARRRGEAVDKLLEAEQTAPQEVRCRPRTHQLVTDLRALGVGGSAEPRLRAFAQRCGMPA